jgi:hypothetical protein
MTRHADVHRLRRVGLDVEAPDLRAALIDDALAVGLRVPRIEIVVIGMALQVGTIRQA